MENMVEDLSIYGLKQGVTLDNGKPRLFYALNEFCLILDKNLLPDRDLGLEKDRQEVYDQIGGELGAIVGDILTNTPLDNPEISDLESDLLPTRAFAGALAERGLNARLRSLPGGAITLSQYQEIATPLVTLAFYGIELGDLQPDLSAPGADQLSADDQDKLARQQGMIQLVNLLNLPLLSTAWAQTRYEAERGRLAKLGIAGATPNWGVAAQQHYCPSPGSFPVPITPEELAAVGGPTGRWRFSFDLQGDPLLAFGENVTVAILDTCPEVEANALSATLQANIALGEALSSAEDAISVDPGTLATIDPAIKMNLRQFNGTPLADLSLADHGVFIAGIVRDIAPQANVRLGRVLNGFGVSNLRGVVEALNKLPGRFPEEFGLQAPKDPAHPSRLIVNLSLGASLPQGEEFLVRCLPTVAQELIAQDYPQLRGAAEVIDMLSDVAINRNAERLHLETLRQSIAAILGWLNAHPGVMVVAAAGNDRGLFRPRITDYTRPEPRWPAQYDVSQNVAQAQERNQVIGVAAVDREGRGTQYSNRGDVSPLGNGIAVLGGESRPTTGLLGAIPLPPEPRNPLDVDAIKGVYSAPLVPTPDGERPNITGWVYWSGTSFSAPIIAGLAAQLWSADLTASPSAIVQRVVTVIPTTKQPDTGLDDLFTPIITAWQTWQP